ncbi:MAG: Unknown protein [uncultured Sulfurovum sp.]|uniref:SPOR domain-containing protein n=1 Tax=uncultured Sulfurovum sp. TaxID=269237 RepID=A0A6S6TZJ2_9BACT|nr:MAG: Unknown protein [uncultured Sulfurovum sp.]
MKILVILFLLNLSLFAQNLIHTIPSALQKKLCGQLANDSNRCDNGSTLTYHTHSNLNNGNLLIFLYLNNHTTTSYNRPHAVIPVIVDRLGRWLSTVGENIIAEDIIAIHHDPHGNIWVQTQWQIEGVYPAYYHSPNGLNWKQTILPKNRNVDCCFEFVDKPTFLYDSITLTFKNIENKNIKSWTANYHSAMSNNPIWQPIVHVPNSSIENITDQSWRVSQTHNRITFLNIYSNKKIFLPIKFQNNKSIYKIQVGAYTQMHTAQKAKRTLQNLAYFTQIVQDKKYSKLFIGEFNTLQKAKAVLSKLKREYPSNKSIQNAFVLKSKP